MHHPRIGATEAGRSLGLLISPTDLLAGRFKVCVFNTI